MGDEADVDKPSEFFGVEFPLSFYGQDGRPLSISFVGRAGAATHRVSIPARGQVILETPIETSGRTSVGWGAMDVPCSTASNDSCGLVAGVVTLRNRNPVRPDFEATFSFRSSTDRTVVPIDNAGGHGTVLFLLNDSQFRTESVTVAFRDQSGTRILLDQFEVPVRNTLLVNVAERWPALSAMRGTADFVGERSSLIVIGLRINPTNSFAAVEGTHPL